MAKFGSVINSFISVMIVLSSYKQQIPYIVHIFLQTDGKENHLRCIFRVRPGS